MQSTNYHMNVHVLMPLVEMIKPMMISKHNVITVGDLHLVSLLETINLLLLGKSQLYHISYEQIEA